MPALLGAVGETDETARPFVGMGWGTLQVGSFQSRQETASGKGPTPTSFPDNIAGGIQ